MLYIPQAVTPPGLSEGFGVDHNNPGIAKNLGMGCLLVA
jgi:hypothetical protein